MAIQHSVKADERHGPRDPTAILERMTLCGATPNANISMMGNSARATATAAGNGSLL